MRPIHERMADALRIVLVLLVGAVPCLAATLSVQVDPTGVKAGDPFTLTVSVEDGTVEKVDLPRLDGLESMPGVDSMTFAFTGGTLITTTTRKYQFIAAQAGDFTIPPFDVTLKGGTTLRSQALKFHVADGGDSPGANTAGSTNTAEIRAGPVVLPPVNPTASADQAGATPGASPDAPATAAATAPRDKDDGPAKVYMVITPQATDAYAGELVPLRIDFYIRQEANADQDSLPTIKGSNFLMNDFAVRGHASLALVEGMPYECDTFLTAIAAPKSGDFPLAVERDTYWVKSAATNDIDPLGFTKSTNLAHGTITSNQFTMHVHSLPDEGRPENFSGAVGEFAVSSDAQPATVAMGEPVTLTFGITGSGNFDYVHCPVLADDAHWKAYAATSTITFTDEERTQGTKTFEQLVMPEENGNVPLPRATFSYFNTRLKQYVTVPINLPTVAVTGAMPIPTATASAPSVGVEISVKPVVADDFLPNRVDLGDTQSNMSPVYQKPWFWILQGVFVALPLLGLLVFFVRRRMFAGQENAESVSRRRSLRQEQSTMADAVRQGDARAFFVAARHAVQLQLGTQWALSPEAITLGEIRRRDPSLAETLTPFFAQTDEVIYSARPSMNIDLAHWDRITRELLQLQAA